MGAGHGAITGILRLGHDDCSLSRLSDGPSFVPPASSNHPQREKSASRQDSYSFRHPLDGKFVLSFRLPHDGAYRSGRRLCTLSPFSAISISKSSYFERKAFFCKPRNSTPSKAVRMSI